jgi:hypothetical protein
VVVAAPDVAVVKSLVEAYEGVASVFGEQGGELTLAAPESREVELDVIVKAIEELLVGLGRQRPR